MPSKRVLNKTITLFNFLGEDQFGQAQYSVTYLENVAVEKIAGAKRSSYSSISDDSVVLYVFPNSLLSYDKNGYKKAFMPYKLWKESNSKEAFWTFRENQKDFFINGVYRDGDAKKNYEAFKIQKVAYFDEGTRRMHHWEINAL